MTINNDLDFSGNSPSPALNRQLPTLSGAVDAPLSDLAVSPFGMPTALLRGEVRVAWVGRASTEEQQDPRQSLIRQLRNSKSALPEAWALVCHFYDIESGRMELEARGRKSGYERFDIPIARDGGIADLLVEAARPNRRFDVVICESVSRTARRMFEGLSIERELERANVPLFASNEPIKLDGGRAQQILMRRINQSVAEYEVLNTLELSWGGLCTHVRDGWNIGKPPHGYRAKQYRHPNPAKAAKGATKTRLEPDGLLGETVTQMALWRYYEHLGYGTIAERLDVDLDRYPPPMPPGGPERARGSWSKSAVRDIMCNPKYTGYQVFNRRATRSKRGAHNDPALWVWSPEPCHEPLIPKWMFDELAVSEPVKRGSRTGGGANKHPATRRTYVFRGRMGCSCGRLMAGNGRPTRTYYSCWPKGNNRGRPENYADHPKSVYIREDVVLDAVSDFLGDRLFGPYRRELYVADLAALDDRAGQQRERDQGRLNAALDTVARRQQNALRQAQDWEPGDPFARGLRETYNTLDRDRLAVLGEIEALKDSDAAASALPTAEAAELFDALPFLSVNLARAPQDLLRPLFDLIDLRITVHLDSDDVTLGITLPGAQITQVGDAAWGLADDQPGTLPGGPPNAQMLMVPPTGFEPVLPP